MSRRILEVERSFDNVAALLNQKSMSACGLQVLEILGTALDCDWGTYWRVDPQAHVLRPEVIWHSKNAEAQKLDKDTQRRTMTLSEGNAGHVWRSRKPMWSVDLVADMCLPRSLDARDAGFSGGVWFAIKTDNAVYGIVELLSRELKSASDELLASVETLGIKIGRSFETQIRSTRT